MFHDSIPHIHNETNPISHAHHKDHEENHHHHHHHHHHNLESSDEPSFLSRLIGAFGDHHNALEIDHFDEDISVKTDSNNGLKIASLKDIVDYPILAIKFNVNLDSNQERTIFESPPLLYEHSKYSSTTLRGPPQFS